MRTALLRRWQDLPFIQKLALLLLALISVPMVGVVAYTTASSRDSLLASTRATNLERARGTAGIIDAYLADARADVRTIASLSSVIDLCREPGAEGVLERGRRSLRAVRDEQDFVAVYVTDRAGLVLLSTDARVDEGTYETGRAYLGAMAGTTWIDEPAFEPFDEKVTLRISHPVRGNDQISGTVTAFIDVAAFDLLVARDHDFHGNGEFPVLWTGSGVRLVDGGHPARRFAPWSELSPDSEVVRRQRLGPAFPAPFVEDAGMAALTDHGAWLLYDPASNPHLLVRSSELGPVLATAVPLRNQPWLYGLLVPEDRVLAAWRRDTLQDWAVAFFIAMSALVLSFIAARSVTQPLRRVTDAARAVARGDLQARVGLAQQDEFGQLGQAFDAMAVSLTDKERQLQAHASDLERRVEERTRVLETLETVSRRLAASLEPRRTGSSLVGIVVPALADFCTVDLDAGNGTLRRIAAAHADPALDRLARALPEFYPASDPTATLTAEQRQTLEVETIRVYELSAGRRFVGYLTVAATTRSSRQFHPDIESIFEEIGRRAGLAFANAQLYQDAYEANRLKDEFLGVVSHELRTPLNAIMGWTRLAGLSKEAGIEPRDALEAVERNAVALSRLVEDLLDVPRIITGKLALERQPIDLVAALTAAVEGAQPAARAKSLRLRSSSAVPAAVVDADPQRLQQVFGNLLNNAIKFTPSGGEVRVALQREGSHLVVTVADTGIGIASDFLPFVFDRFRQADSSASRAHGGLGIGLSIVRHLTEMHGGDVSVASPGPGHGSTFTVRLPVAETAPAISENRLTADVAETHLRDLALLVVDDDPDARDVVTRLLMTAGAQVTSVGSAADALAVLERDPSVIDAILADIGMPVVDGYSLVSQLRAADDIRLRALPVIAVTAYASRADRARALAAGFNGHVAKPVRLSAISDTLLSVLRQQSRAN